MPDHPLLAGRYALGHELGRGGMGQVVLARDTVLDRDVAIKTLHLDLAGDPSVAERFRREARAVAQLTHPNVVTIHDLGTTDHTAYMVMERLPGPNLQRLVAQRGALPIPEVLAYGEQTARGLAAAHARGILHRDIKPSNLMLAADGTIKVVDFGIAAFLGEAGLTATSDYVGTPAYTAPERAAYAPATEASDLYALGCVLYFLATERPPFEPPDVLHQHLTARPPALVHLRADAPPGLVALVDQLLAKDPAARPRSAGEVADRLRGVAGAAPQALVVDPPTRHRTPPPAASTPLSPQPEADPTTATQLRRERSDAAGAGSAPRRVSFLAIAAVLAVLLAAIPVARWGVHRFAAGGEVTTSPGATTDPTTAAPTTQPPANEPPTSAPSSPSVEPTATGGGAAPGEPTFALTSGGTSAFLVPILGEFTATVTEAHSDGARVFVSFEARGQSNMRRPEDTCLIARSNGGAEYRLPAVSTTLTSDEATHRTGTWEFFVPVGGTYSVRYDCADDYSDAPLGTGEMPSWGVTQIDARQFAVVTAFDRSTVEMVVVAPSVPATACLASDAGRAGALTAERIGETGRTWRATATFAEDPTGQQLTLGCDPAWPAVRLP